MRKLLSEEEKKDKCVCESCNNKKGLKHFEECPKCYSRAWHKTIKQFVKRAGGGK